MICRLLVSVGVVCLAVVAANVLFDLQPVIAIVFGGGAGFVISGFVSRSFGLNRHDRDRYVDRPITGPKWFAMWFFALCAFHFLVGLALVESVCCVVALMAFFMVAERYNRARAAKHN